MGSDEQLPESRTVPTTHHTSSLDLEVGDFFPYRDGQGGLNYGRISKIDPERDTPYRVSLPEVGYIWLSEDRYDTDVPKKYMVAARTAGELYPRVEAHNGR